MKKILFYIFVLSIMVGFRVFPNGNSWSISPSDPKIWIVSCPMNLDFSINNLPAGDPLYSQAVSISQILNSIYTDYNNVSNSFIVLSDAGTDPTYNTTAAAQRTITICTGSTGSLASAIAEPKLENGKSVGCNITIGKTATDDLRNFVSTMTHELGHCLGLDHAQETTHAIMSYYHSRDLVRLQIDDKMGLIYLYPDNAANSKETMTYGLSCSPR